LGLFEFVIAVAIIVGAPIVFWFVYSIVAVRLGWEPRGKSREPKENASRRIVADVRVQCASARAGQGAVPARQVALR